ncbi:MAG: aconitate hydratase AcnA [Acidobacteriota bacterium]
MPTPDTFGTLTTLNVSGQTHAIHSLGILAREHPGISRLPASLRILLENLLRSEAGRPERREAILGLLDWDPAAKPSVEIAFRPARVLLQDFTGVPCVVDLAAMRDAITALGGDGARINPLEPVDLVIDHSVQVDAYGSHESLARNTSIELERNRERYAFLRWGQGSFRSFRVVPPETGIVHQVNLEYLAPVVMQKDGAAYFDTLVGTDSHTTMVNGLGVLGWGVGGIEAEAAMLGQPVSMLIPEVIGFRLSGKLAPGTTATDAVLTVTQMLRAKKVVGKFVEFYGPGLDSLSLADRATIANMAPEYGATVGYFPIDRETISYLAFSGRPAELVALVEAYAKEQGVFRTPDSPEPLFSDTLELDLGTVEPSMAGPKRPQDRVALAGVPASFEAALGAEKKGDGHAAGNGVGNGSVVIAAITSCTNTSNPSVMVAAGLLARNAAARGLAPKPWVKTSLAPGSKVVTDYLKETGLLASLEACGFHVVGYGCTTCIGNSGPLPDDVTKAVKERDLVVASVLSGNRNFEGRVHALVKANYLASPPLVVAYALAGRIDLDLTSQPLGAGRDGKPVFLKDVWPSADEVAATVKSGVKADQFRARYADVFRGPDYWAELPAPKSEVYAWDGSSTYIRKPPYFEGMPRTPAPLRDIAGARVLAVLGDSVTTDHISPAGSIQPDGPAGRYLQSLGIGPKDFNSYGARRGNHEVMVRGTFANVRLKNLLAPGTTGGVTVHLPDGAPMSIYDAAMAYRDEGVSLIVLAGLEYGTGSSRDWAAKGVALLGVRAVIARTFERIHRSNLVGMGVLPLEHVAGEDRESLGLSGKETFAIDGIADGLAVGKRLTVRATDPAGAIRTFEVVARVDTPDELQYFRHGGILPYVLRQLVGGAA